MERELHTNRRNLSPQQRACLALLLDGRTNAEVAKALDLSPTTVASYLKAVYRKLGTQNRTHAVAVAIYEGIVPAEDEIDIGSEEHASTEGPKGFKNIQSANNHD